MKRKLAAARPPAKKRRCPEGNPNCPQGNPISPVMQKVRSSLNATKSARELHFLTGQSLSICQKTLCGQRAENAAMLAALFQTRLIAAAVIGLTEGATDPDVKAIRKAAQRVLVEQRHRRDLAELEAAE